MRTILATAGKLFSPILYPIVNDSQQFSCLLPIQAPVVQTLDSAIQWINIYSVDSAIDFPNTYPMDSAIQRLNNRGQVFYALSSFSFHMNSESNSTGKLNPVTQYP